MMKISGLHKRTSGIENFTKLATSIALALVTQLVISGCSNENNNGSNQDPGTSTGGIPSVNGGSGGGGVDVLITGGQGEQSAGTGGGTSGGIDGGTGVGISSGGTGGDTIGPKCGNGALDPGENCDTRLALGESCESLGFLGGGQLACNPTTCQFDVAGCMEATGDDGGGADNYGGSGGSGGMDTIPSGDTGTLPVPDSLDGPGPFEVSDQANTGPNNAYHLFLPQPLGQDGIKHPVVAWSPGAGAFPEAYWVLLTRLASQGFVTLSYNTTGNGPVLVDAIDWLIAENERQGSELYGMLDTSKIAAGGHSAGSLATYQMADDPRLTTTLHISGGSFNASVDVPMLRNPTLMVCGDAGGDGLTTGDIANPMCGIDFDMATVPVFYAVVVGGGHANLNDAEATMGVGTVADDPRKLLFIKAMVGWLRWQLADDQSLKDMFVGPDCGLCGPDSGYIVQQKDLN